MAHSEKVKKCRKRSARNTAAQQQQSDAASLGRQRSASEPKLNRRHDSVTTLGDKDGIWSTVRGFPPGVTVDELSSYRRKRPAGFVPPRDNLFSIQHGAKDSLKHICSEYTRCFKPIDFSSCEDLSAPNGPLNLLGRRKNHPSDSLLIDKSPMAVVTEQHAQYIPYEGYFKPEMIKRSSSLNRDGIGEGDFMEKNSESSAQFVLYPYAKPRDLIRRPTSLRIEGDMRTSTEQAENFIAYILSKRPELIRKSTNLKLEGDMDITTEKADQYIRHENIVRPPLCKKKSNLHLEGDLIFEPEYTRKFTAFEVIPRPSLIKSEPNLHLDGHLEFYPEYSEQFVPLGIQPRSPLIKKTNNLHLEGNFELNPEYNEKFVVHESLPRPKLMKKESNLHLEGSLDFEPEYKNQFSNYQYSKRPPLIRKGTNLHMEGNSEMNPEYKEQFTTNEVKPRERFIKRKTNLQLEGSLTFEPEYGKQFTTPQYSRREPMLKKDSNLKFEGSVDMEPEYTKQFKTPEYSRREQIIKKDSNLKFEGSIDMEPEYTKQFKTPEYSKRESIAKKESNLKLEGSMDMEPEYTKKFKTPAYSKRESISKKEPNLKLEGSFSMEPEYTKEFKIPEYSRRDLITKKEPNLKLEGTMDMEPEYMKQFKSPELKRREPMMKRESNLKLEGSLDFQPEYQKQFKKFEYSKRPPFLKKGTNLHLEGSIDLEPEYREMYKEYPPLERVSPKLPKHNLTIEGGMKGDSETMSQFKTKTPGERVSPKLPKNNLKSEGELGGVSETTSKFSQHTIANKTERSDINKHSQNLKMEGAREFSPVYTESYIKHNVERHKPALKPESNLKPEGRMSITTESGDQFVSSREPMTKVFHKKSDSYLKVGDSYTEKSSESNVHFAKPEISQRTDTKKRSDSIRFERKIDLKPEYKQAYIELPREKEFIDKAGKRRRSKSDARLEDNIKFEGKMDIYPEYRASYIDFPRSRPAITKPVCNLRNEGTVDHITEKSAQYIEHLQVPKIEAIIPESELKLEEGNFGCQPEYRRAYNDYIQREQIERLTRPIDTLNLREIHTDDEIAMRQSRPDRAFQVLCTKGTKSEAKRLGITDQKYPFTKTTPVSRSIRNRSPSPTFRLQVTNVDDNGGFNRRKHSVDLLPISNRRKSSTASSLERTDNVPKTPARRKRWNTSKHQSRRDSCNKPPEQFTSNKAFVVLDSNQDSSQTECNNNIIEKCDKTINNDDNGNWNSVWTDSV